MTTEERQERRVRVALCQVETRPWDLDGNADRLLVALDRAAREGAELAVTPECVFHGYGDPPPGEHVRGPLLDAAETMEGGPRVRAVRAAAARHGMDVVLGFAERSDDGARLHNTAALISGRGPDAGGVVYAYRKVHCRPFESAEHQGAFTPGDAFHVAAREYAGGRSRVGTFICFDREIPESARCLRALGAELIACPLATPTYDLYRPPGEGRADNEVITRARAAENEVYIAVVNHAGRFNGGSLVVGPLGEPVAQMGSRAGVLVVDLPLGRVAEHHHADPLGWMGWGYRRPAVYDRYLGVKAAPAPP